METRDPIQPDILCIGGGIAGLMAAIRAGELGADVVVAEKGNTLTSGAGGIGNDHFLCYLPKVHGPDVMPVIEELRRGQLRARLKDTAKTRIWLEHTADIVNLWNSWGIPMKYQGRYEFAGHAYPQDSYPCHLKYEGRKQKAVLTKQALMRGVKIINRAMMFELFRDQGLFVTVGLNTRTGKLFEIQAKCVILGTGTVARLYQGLTPGWMANATRPGTLTGDGRIMAYKAGAELFNVETLEHHAGPKYFTRSGQATWVGVVRDPQDEPVGPFLTQPDRRYSDMIIEVDKEIFAKYARSGKGPLYMDCRDETTRSISPAAVFGWIAGEHAAGRIGEIETGLSVAGKTIIEEKAEMLRAMQRRENGPDWKEANIALQQIMSDYAGSIRSKALLESGCAHLERLKQEAESFLVARNPHQWSRALEVLNLIELGQLVCTAALERRETRGQHNRVDYPYTNPVLDRTLIVKNVNGRPVTEWR
ncbi:MAG: FAD-binding protein [Deltaproteobacteria bacterium]